MLFVSWTTETEKLITAIKTNREHRSVHQSRKKGNDFTSCNDRKSHWQHFKTRARVCVRREVGTGAWKLLLVSTTKLPLSHDTNLPIFVQLNILILITGEDSSVFQKHAIHKKKDFIKDFCAERNTSLYEFLFSRLNEYIFFYRFRCFQFRVIILQRISNLRRYYSLICIYLM